MTSRAGTPSDSGDPSDTPFVRFHHGTPSYPRNDIYPCAGTFLSAIHSESVSDVLKRLVRRGPLGHDYGVVLEATWYALIQGFIRFNEAKAVGVPNAEARCIEALQMMVQGPPESVWPKLRDYL